MQIYISRDGEQNGPYGIEDVNAYLEDGTLLPTDLACQEDMTEWVPISQIPGVVMPANSAAPPMPSSRFASKPAPPEPDKEVKRSELEERKDAARRQVVKHAALLLVVGLPFFYVCLLIIAGIFTLVTADQLRLPGYLIPKDGSTFLVMMAILLSSIWAGNDSSKIEFEKYKSTISNGPFMITLGCLAAWIVIFPWYLFQRNKIVNGLAELKVRPSLPSSRHGDEPGVGNVGHHSQPAFTEVPTSWMRSKLIILILWLIFGVIVLGAGTAIGGYVDSRIIAKSKADGKFFGTTNKMIINAATGGHDWYYLGITAIFYAMVSGGVYYYTTRKPSKR